MTLGFIAVLTALILQTVSISKSSFDDLMDIKIQNQELVFMQDLINIINKFEPKDFKDNFVDKEAIPVMDDKSGLNLTISCISMGKRFNLNQLLLCKKDKSDICDNVIREFAKKYELADGDYLLALLKDTVNFHDNERASGSRISFYDKTFSDGKIINYKTITQIEDYYYHELKDENIYKISKEDFLNVFYLFDQKTDNNNTDATPTFEVCDILGFKDDKESCKTEFNKINKSIKPTLKEETKSKANKKNHPFQTNNLIQCTVNYYKGDETHSIVFKYNLGKNSKKRVVSIDEFF